MTSVTTIRYNRKYCYTKLAEEGRQKMVLLKGFAVLFSGRCWEASWDHMLQVLYCGRPLPCCWFFGIGDAQLGEGKARIRHSVFKKNHLYLQLLHFEASSWKWGRRSSEDAQSLEAADCHRHLEVSAGRIEPRMSEATTAKESQRDLHHESSLYLHGLRRC